MTWHETKTGFSRYNLPPVDPSTMKPAVALLCLSQGNKTIENYIFEFLEISNHVDFNDVAFLSWVK